jgi:hypothetical protein
VNIPSRNEEVTENIPNNHKEVVKNIPSWQEEFVNMPNSHDEVSGNIPIVRMWTDEVAKNIYESTDTSMHCQFGLGQYQVKSILDVYNCSSKISI